VRRIAAIAFGAGLVACASIGAPPGGPQRTTPPELLSITPESGAVDVRARSVVLTFDAVLNDRPAGGDLDKLFILSPQEGRPRVRWRRERIEISPRRGFRPNTAYSLTMLPGLSDLRGNTMKTGRTFIFSTGPTIPPFYILGRVFDWMAERVAPRALLVALRRPDSLPYMGVADTAGQFGIGPLAEGSYTLRAIIDANNNRELDPGESWDSVDVTVAGGASPFVELLTAPRDTIGPRIQTLTAPDTLTLVAAFDRPIDPEAPPGAQDVRVVAADSTPLRVAGVLTKAQADSIQRARSDSVQRALLDSALRADTSARADSTLELAPRRDTSLLRGGPVLPQQPRPSRPPPPREVTIKLDPATPLHSGSAYRVTVTNARGLLGRSRTSERVVTVPRARPDSARAAVPGATLPLPQRPPPAPQRPPP
jgi:hypothetical protein